MKTSLSQAVKGITAATLFSLSAASFAAPMFYLSPGTDPNGDLAWQGDAGSFSEQNFESGFSQGQELDTFNVGSHILDVSLPNAGSEFVRIFQSPAYAGAGGVNGTVFNFATGSFNNTQGDNELLIEFAAPVFGFGVWLFDDGSSTADSITMTVNGLTSAVLDSAPGSTSHAVEGFLGVIDNTGISSVLITGTSSFEADSFQVSNTSLAVPSPTGLALMLLALPWLAWRKLLG